MYNLLSIKGCTSPSQMDLNSAALFVQMQDLPLACMIGEIGNQIGQTIWKVLKCDVDDNRLGCEEVLRVLIEVYLRKVIPREEPS